MKNSIDTKYNMNMKGVITITNTKTGEVREFTNLVTNVFFNAIAKFFTGSPSNGIRYFAVGTGTTTAVATMTALTTEYVEPRKLISNLSTADSEMIFLVTIDATDFVGQWNELGLFEDSSTGSMYTIANIDYEHITGEILNITYKISRV